MRSISSGELFSVLIDSTGLLSERVGGITFSTVENKSGSEMEESGFNNDGLFFSESIKGIELFSDFGKFPFPFKIQYKSTSGKTSITLMMKSKLGLFLPESR